MILVRFLYHFRRQHLQFHVDGRDFYVQLDHIRRNGLFAFVTHTLQSIQRLIAAWQQHALTLASFHNNLSL